MEKGWSDISRMTLRGALLYPRDYLPTVNPRIAKPKVNTRENINYRPASTYKMPSYKKVDYKCTAKPKLETRSNAKYTPTARKPEQYYNDVKKFRNVKCKVDTRDPAPYSHQTMHHSLSTLIDIEGLYLNPRFSSVINSGPYTSAEDIIFHTLHSRDGSTKDTSTEQRH